MFAVMADLEALCARGAALAMTAAELRALQEIVTAAAALTAANDREGYAALNEAFHDTVCRGAHNAYLLQLTLETRSRLAPFRHAQFSAPGRLERSLAEHRQVLAAIGRRDAAGAFEAMRAHIVIVRDAVELIGGNP